MTPAPSGPAPLPNDPIYLFIYLKVEYQLVRIVLSCILRIKCPINCVKVHLASTLRPWLSLTNLRSM
jgi:two-component system response regulator LytT